MKGIRVLSLEQLQLDAPVLEMVSRLERAESGLVLVSGQAGRGRTTPVPAGFGHSV